MWVELPEAMGRLLFLGQLCKGAGHKYIKRVPYTDSKGRRRYRYFYKVSAGYGVQHEFHFVEGAAFRVAGGHYHVTKVDGDRLTIKHDETGEVLTVTKAQLSGMLGSHHAEALEKYRGELKTKLESATGNAQRGAIVARLERFGGKVPLKEALKPAKKPAEPMPTKDEPAPSGEAVMPAASTDGKLEATGDHIWGSRKDLAGLGFIKSAADLEGMSHDDAAAIVRKNKLLEPLTVAEAKAAGMTPGTAHLLMGLFASIRQKPGDSVAERAAYVDEIRQLQGAQTRVKTLDEFQGLLGEMRAARRNAKKWEDVGGPFRGLQDGLTAAKAELERLKKDDPTGDYRVGSAFNDSYGTYRVYRKAPKPYDALGRNFIAFIDGKSQDKKSAYHRAFDLDNAWTYSASKQSMTTSEAWGWLEASTAASKAKAEETEKKKGKPKGDDGKTARGWSGAKDVAGDVERVGGSKVSGASAERTKKTFALREVDYGQSGYMTQADREYHTEALEGALHDLADVMAIPKEQVSFSGRLGVALGARGTGKAAAHYEPGRHVINITKFRGGGSLAHEWGHALDDIISSHYIKTTERSHLSHTPEHSDLPAGLSTAVSAVMAAINRHPDPARAKKEHADLSKKLLERANEVVMRSNALVSSFKELQSKPTTREIANRRIENLQGRIGEWERERAAFVEKESRAKSSMGKFGAHAEQEHRERWIASANQKIAELKGSDAVLSDADTKRMAEIEEAIEALRPEMNRASKAYNDHRKINPEISDFAKSAAVLGKSYWGTPHEMFARAFESWTEDKLSAAGRKNTYLVDGTARTYNTEKPIAEGKHAQPYPTGEERKAINKAIDGLVAVLRSEKHIAKALAGMAADAIAKASAPRRPVIGALSREQRSEYPFAGTIDAPGGIKVDVENRAGSTRSGAGPDGTWSVKMRHHYGEIRGTEGVDGDPLDVYVGDDLDSPLVVVVHQQDPKTKRFDENKVMLGWRSVADAVKAYKAQYDKPGFYGGHTAISVPRFWRWVQDGKGKGKAVAKGMAPNA